MSVIIKATEGPVTRRLPFQEPRTLASLRTQLSSHFALPSEARLTYKDEDGDDITFSTDAELVDQLHSAEANPTNVLRLSIVTDTPPTSSPSPQLDDLVTNISDLVTAIRGQPPAKRVCVRGLSTNAEQSQPRRGIFGGIRPFFAAFPPKQQLRASAKAVDQETRVLFKKSASAIKKSKQRKQLLNGLKDATPALREFITDLPDEGMPSAERVKVLVNAVETSIDGVDDEVDPKIIAFIDKACTDPALVDCLRQVKDVHIMPWEPGFIKRASTARGFDVHQVACCGCQKHPIVGIRYESQADGYNLCEKCRQMPNLMQGRSFVPRKFIWEKNYEGLTVPPPPITTGDRGNKVKFLHKVLTDLGFMNSSMYNRRPGLFAHNTQRAVAAFQAENNINGAPGVYDEATANRMKQIIDERDLAEATADCTMQPGTDTAMKT